LLLPVAAPLIGVAIVISGALYFADRRMKTDDNHFRGFPALWNAAAFYLQLLKPSPVLGTIVLAVFVGLTFVPFHTLHPLRTLRWRPLTLALIGIWAVLTIFTVVVDFNVPTLVKIALCGIAGYVLFSDLVVQTYTRIRP
jgi:phosphatidylcholine synthase